jgi:hypothetical protein
MKYTIHYTLAGTLIVGPVVAPLNESHGPVRHDPELYAALPPHLWDNGPESPGRGPVIEVAVAASTTSVSSSAIPALWPPRSRL